MDITDIRSELVDGGVVLIPDEPAWRVLKKVPKIGEMPLALPNLAWFLLEFCQKQKSHFKLGLYKGGAHARSWCPIVLFKVNHRWQRVHIERLTCARCGWQGMAATPSVAAIYDGVPNIFEAMREGTKIPVVPCPRCGGKLPERYPIWAEADNAST